jgi:hypothetical protein
MYMYVRWLDITYVYNSSLRFQNCNYHNSCTVQFNVSKAANTKLGFRTDLNECDREVLIYMY